MTAYSVTRTINAPAQRVWDLLTDVDTYQDWNPTIVSISGSITEGGHVELVSKVNPQRSFKLKVHDVQPPRSMVWSSGIPGMFKGERTYRLTPVGDGGASTEFYMEEVYSGLMAPLVVKSIPDMQPSFEQIADGLKSAAEA